MWAEAGLNWSDFLPEDQDVNKFVTLQVCKLTGKVLPDAPPCSANHMKTQGNATLSMFFVKQNEEVED